MELLALGERLGGVLRATRAFYAVVPLAIPLVLASVDSAEPPSAAPRLEPAPIRVAPIRYSLLGTAADPLPSYVTYTRIQPGDTLESVFMRAGLTAPEANALARSFAGSVDPRRLRPGNLVRAARDGNERIVQIGMRVRGWGAVDANRLSDDSFAVVASQEPERWEETTIAAGVEHSLFGAVTSLGESPELVQKLVDVFQWDVDFFSLKSGDAFSAVVEKKFVGPDHVGYGPILAAQFRHGGKVYEAFRYESAGNSGYFTRDGRPVRKQFLKAPLSFTRITSGFTHKRFHPVLKKFRPHYGVDYGAPTGTPVMSTADGVVVFAGFDRGEGNYVTIRHNSRIETSYLHLSRFAKGIRKGMKVTQGDVIGYVGSTGMSTGPHLDYRVRDGGKWLNPLQLKSITPDPLRGVHLARFRSLVAARSAKLQRSQELLASADKRRPALF